MPSLGLDKWQEPCAGRQGAYLASMGGGKGQAVPAARPHLLIVWLCGAAAAAIGRLGCVETVIATFPLCHMPAACSKVEKKVGKQFSEAFFLTLWLSFSAIAESAFPTSFLFHSAQEIEG